MCRRPGSPPDTRHPAPLHLHRTTMGRKSVWEWQYVAVGRQLYCVGCLLAVLASGRSLLMGINRARAVFSDGVERCVAAALCILPCRTPNLLYSPGLPCMHFLFCFQLPGMYFFSQLFDTCSLYICSLEVLPVMLLLTVMRATPRGHQPGEHGEADATAWTTVTSLQSQACIMLLQAGQLHHVITRQSATPLARWDDMRAHLRIDSAPRLQTTAVPFDDCSC